MKHLIILATIWLVSAANTVNYCGQNSCCTSSSCNSCANNCRYQCQTESCTNNCINNCIQAVPQTCSGGSCNVCSGNQCCSSNYCNQCASTCTNQCSTQTCRNSCVNKCIQTSPSCEGQNCNTNNVCVGGQCCNNQNCNTCVNQCYTQRSGCTRACVRDCIQPEPVRIDIPIPERECNNLQFSNDHTTHGSSNQNSDVKTIVDLNNIINNTNHIHVPIRINNTNINHVRFPKKTVPRDVELTGKQETNQTVDGCCYVLHPRECYKVEDKIRCYQRRHRECSSICTSSVVLITPQPQPIPIPQPYPIPYPFVNQQPQNKCHYIQKQPYAYCGNFQKHNCGDCYSCGQGSQTQCANGPQCPSACRNNVLQ